MVGTPSNAPLAPDRLLLSCAALASHFCRSHLRTSFCLGLVHRVTTTSIFGSTWCVFLLNICGSKVLPGGRCGPESRISRLFCLHRAIVGICLIQALPVLMHCVPANQHYQDGKSWHLRTTRMQNPGTSKLPDATQHFSPASQAASGADQDPCSCLKGQNYGSLTVCIRLWQFHCAQIRFAFLLLPTASSWMPLSPIEVQE